MTTEGTSGGTQEKPTSANPISFSQDVKVSLAGMGDLINVRFRVKEEMYAGGPMFLQDEATGAICKLVAVPKIGTLMSKTTETGGFGFAFFFNPNNVVKYNSKVTFVAGQFRFQNLSVT